MVTKTSELILAAACAEVCDRGVNGARVDAIAEQAGVNKRMIYHYFDNKAGLCDAVLRRELAIALQHPLLSATARDVLHRVATTLGMSEGPSTEAESVVTPGALKRAMTTLMTEFARADVQAEVGRLDVQAWLNFCLEASSWMLADVTPVLFGRPLDDQAVRNMSEAVSSHLVDWNGGRRRVRLSSATRLIEPTPTD